jgi:hypothetical protein
MGVDFGFSEPSEHLAVYGKGRLPPFPSIIPIVPRQLFISPILRKFLFREIARIAGYPVYGHLRLRFSAPLPLVSSMLQRQAGPGGSCARILDQFG